MSASVTKPPLDLSLEETSVSSGGGPSSEGSEDALSPREALPSLLAFSTLQSQVGQRKEAISSVASDPALQPSATTLQMLQDEVLDLVARRALGMTGADGIAIALADGDQIICRASAGTVVPDAGARLDPNSGFSGTCFRTGTVVRCDSVDEDQRVNRQACLQLGARSMLAVPLLGRVQTLGLIEAFSADEYAFNEADVRILSYLAEVILGALRQEETSHKTPKSRAEAQPIEAEATKSAVVAAPKISPPTKDAPKPTADPTLVTPRSAVKTAVNPDPVVEAASEIPTPLANRIAEPASRPGLVVVIAVVLAACLLAGGLWWQIHSKTSTANSKSLAASPQSPEINSVASGNVTTQTPQQPADDAALASEIASEASTKSGPFPEVTSIRHWTSGRVSNVVVDLQDQVPYEAHRLGGPDRIYFDLHDASLNTSLAGKAIAVGDPVLSRIRAAQLNAGVVRVVLDTTANSKFSVSLEHDPYRLLVQIHDGASPSPDSSKVSLFPATPEPSAKLAALPSTSQGDQARLQAHLPKLKIVLDAGHGGWDLGTVGRKGLLEKDLVLDISQRLGKLLQNRLGSDVLYTRNDDYYISLDQRAASANSAQADLFVSIHANYSDMPSARGVETYYTQSFTAPGPQELDTMSSASPATRPTFTLSTAELKEKIQESRRLAAAVQQSMYSTLADPSAAIRNRGVKEASYVVLTGTEMPGILAEVSFVSSPADETNLQREEYRQRIAEALYRGIARYASSASRTKLAKASTAGAGQ
jgi:N-acetylmuramoyl-L-alanine amidase